MPRNVDPGTIRVGKGLAPEGTVEDNSLRYPERDADPLRVHIHDPSRAHMASAIGIVDEADCYVSDEVEGALQELCASSGAGRLNGLIAGGTFSELGCLPNGTAGGVHATLTLCSPTEIMMNGSVFDAAGLTVSVPAGNVTYFIYLDTHPPSPTYRELVAATGSPPEVEAGIPDATTGPDSIEQVMLAKVFVDNLGNVDTWQDARFFVRNLDRKVQYSSRQGENVDAWSEGCFANLQAFFFWAEYYGDGFLPTSDEEEKGTVLLRGTHSITAPLVIPTDHLQFVGDGDAVIELNAGAPFYGLTFNDKSHLTFRNLTFKANVGGCMGIVGGGNYSDITIEDCRFAGGGTKFHTGISLTGGLGNVRLLVRDCYMEVTNNGVEVDGFGTSAIGFGAKIQDCVVQGASSNVAGSRGVLAGGAGGSADLWITGCQISDTEQGLSITNTTRTVVSDCNIREVVSGIIVPAGDTLATKISDCTIVLTDNASLHGIQVGGGNKNIGIFNNYVRSLVQNGQPSEPFGIGIIASKGNENANPRIVGNTVIGFFDDVASEGHGIACWGTDGQGIAGTITGNILSRCDISVSYWEDMTISGNSVNTGVYSGLIGGPTVGGAINVVASTGVTIQGNGLNCGATIPHGVEMRLSQYLTVTGNTIRNPATTGILAAASHPTWPGTALMKNFTITGNVVDGWIDDQNPPTAIGIRASASTDDGAPERGVIDGNNIQRCKDGIVLVGFAPSVPIVAMTVSNNQIAECAHDQDTVDPFDFLDAGCFGVGCVYGKNIHISGNTMERIGVVTDSNGTPYIWPQNVYPKPIFALNSSSVSVVDNQIDWTVPFGTGRVANIFVGVGSASGGAFTSSNIKIEGNLLNIDDPVNATLHTGIQVWATDPNADVTFQQVSISGNTIYTKDGPAGTGLGAGIVAAVHDRAILSGLAVENNSIENYLNRGIILQVSDATPNGDSTAVNVRIRNNSMMSMQAVTGLGDGIFIEGLAPDHHHTYLHQLLIEGNVVEDSWGNGITMNFVSANGTGPLGLENIAVVGNTIDRLQKDHPDGGVALDITIDGGTNERIVTNFPAWDVTGCSQFVISDNHFTQVGRALDFDGRNCLLYQNFTIDNNRWHGVGGNTAPATDSLSQIQLWLTDTDSMQMTEFWSISGNQMELVNSDRMISNFRFIAYNCYHAVTKVEDNTINASTHDSGDPNEHGASFVWNTTNTAIPLTGMVTMNDTFFGGNVFGGALYIDASRMDVGGLDIRSNQIKIPLVTEYVAGFDAHTISVNLDGQKFMGHSAVGINITDNTLTGGTNGVALKFDDMDVSSTTIARNSIMDCQAAGISLLNDMSPGTGYFSDWVRNTQITDNVIARINGEPIMLGILYAAGTAGTQSLEVSRNQIRQAQSNALGAVQAIAVYLGGEVPGASVDCRDRNISIDDNIIDCCYSTDLALPIIEVSVAPQATITSMARLTNLSICRNKVSESGYVDGVQVIYVDLSDYGHVDTLAVSDNQVMQALGIFAGGAPDYGSGIEMDLPGTSRLQICRNNLRIKGFAGNTPSGYGVYLQFFENTVTSITVSDNIISGGSSNVDAGIRVRFLGDEDIEAKAIVMKNNQIHSSTEHGIGYGIWLKGETGANTYNGVFRDCVFQGNSVYNCQRGVIFHHSFVGALHTVGSRDCSVDDNVVDGCSVDGIEFLCGGEISAGGSTLGLSVSRNRIQTAYDNQNHGVFINVELGFSIIGSPGSPVTLHMISMDDNHCYMTNPPEPDDPMPPPTQWSGVVFNGSVIGWDEDNLLPRAGVMSTISMNGNHVRNCGGYGVAIRCVGWYSMSGQLAVDSSSNGDCISMSNNLIRREDCLNFRGATDVDLYGVRFRQFSFTNNQVHSGGIGSNIWGMAFQSIWSGSTTNVDFKCSRWTVTGNCANAPAWGTTRPVYTDWGNGYIPIKGTVADNLYEPCDVGDGFNDTNWLFGNNHDNLLT